MALTLTKINFPESIAKEGERDIERRYAFSNICVLINRNKLIRIQLFAREIHDLTIIEPETDNLPKKRNRIIWRSLIAWFEIWMDRRKKKPEKFNGVNNQDDSFRSPIAMKPWMALTKKIKSERNWPGTQINQIIQMNWMVLQLNDWRK